MTELKLITMLVSYLISIWWMKKDSDEFWQKIHKENKEYKEAMLSESKRFNDEMLEIERSRK